jgi:myo-inositol-1(or 4)-monophosphatase
MNDLEYLRSLFTSIIVKIEGSLDLLQSKRGVIKIKTDDSPLTDADLLIEGILKSELKTAIKDLVVISEESFNFDFFPIKDSYYAIVDPLDGTENFSAGLPLWGVSVSIWKYPNHLFSILMLPELKKYLMTGDALKYHKSRIIGFSSSLDYEIINSIDPYKENRIYGCSVFNTYNVISGSFSEFRNYKGAYIWDLIAGINLALEHGYKVIVDNKEYYGEFLDPNQRHRFEIKR